MSSSNTYFSSLFHVAFHYSTTLLYLVVPCFAFLKLVERCKSRFKIRSHSATVQEFNAIEVLLKCRNCKAKVSTMLTKLLHHCAILSKSRQSASVTRPNIYERRKASSRIEHGRTIFTTHMEYLKRAYWAISKQHCVSLMFALEPASTPFVCRSF